MRTVASYIRVLVFLTIASLFLAYVADTEHPTKAFSEFWFWGTIAVLGLLMIAGELCISALQAVLFKSLKPEAQAKYLEHTVLQEQNRFSWVKEKYEDLLGSKPMEEEQEIVLDHNYDGIKELDNNLPPWWVYMFYATIVFAVVYLVRFEVIGDYNQDEEYEAAVAEAKLEIEEYRKTAKDLVDVNSVILLTDASDINAGKAIFEQDCVACHKADGGGGIGPNLTDTYWILGGGIKNVFNTISEGGRDGKGMISWRAEFKPSEIAQVGSYLLTFQGTTPAEPKAPEGDVWVDDSEVPKESVNTEVKVEQTDTIINMENENQ
ncbi:MAG: c-type cytochrome [Flavobacteriaceae bacterium]|nr:c-type cytochrome [Flavobacteriaceae bacterium]